MSFLKPIKAVLYFIVSFITVYILGSVTPRLIDMATSGSSEKIFLTAFYWIMIFAILIFPQFIAWFTDYDIHIITPIISIITCGVAVLVTIFGVKIINTMVGALSFSDFSLFIIHLCKWMGIVGGVLAPQYFVWKNES